MCLLAAEMMAVEQSSPGELYAKLTERLGAPAYQRLDAPADDHVRAKLAALTPESVTLKTLGGSAVTSVLTRAPGNDASIGGVKVVSDDGWFAVRPSGKEAIFKVYTESFKGEDHLQAVQKDAIDFLEQLLKSKD